MTDRWSAYPGYPTRWRQSCWAHLRRDFAALSERGGQAQAMGAGLREQARQRLPWGIRAAMGPCPMRRAGS